MVINNRPIGEVSVALDRVENCLKLNNIKYTVDNLDLKNVGVNFSVDGLDFKTVISYINEDILVTLSCEQISEGRLIALQDLLNFINNCTDIFSKEIILIDKFKKNKIKYEVKEADRLINALNDSPYDYKLVSKNKINILQNFTKCTVNFLDDNFVLMEYSPSDIQLVPYRYFITNLSNGHLLN
ncbi:hypothetical protein [Paraclostridium bifermentans]|uniref:hypothetical protein n=1 Tax=Paraclostridium bifermentans TaxID=1490 RepID=UPI00374F8CAD